MRFLRSCLLILTLAALAQPAHAAAINKEGAAQLKTIVQNFIAEQKKLAEIDGKTKINYQGEVLVEEAGDYYAVTLPYTKIIHADGNQVDVGMISINTSPGDAPGQWKMRVAIPTPIITTDVSGKEVVRTTISGQRAAGIWDEKLQSFVKLDALYKDILFSGVGGSVKIPETQIVYDFTKNEANKWSGPGSIVMKNVESVSNLNEAALKADMIKLSFTIDQYNSDAIRIYREKLSTLAESIVKDSATKGAMNPNQTTAIANMLMDFFTNVGNGLKFGYEFSGVTVKRPATEQTPVQTIVIPTGALGMDLTGMNTGKLHFSIKGGHNGLTITPEPVDSAGLTPSSSNIDITIENVPLREILDLGKNTIDASLQNPEMKQIAGISFMLKLPALLSQAGTTMTVKDTHVGNKDIDINLNGNARADISAVNSATANAKATFRGLDKLLGRLKEQEKNPKGKDLQKLRSTITQLEAIKQKAKVETTPDGQTLHVIEFQMTPQGQILLNGQDTRAAKPIEKPAKAPKP